MRKYNKNVVLELIGTLKEATFEIVKAFDNNDNQTLSVLLGDCDAFTAYISDYIGQLQGKKIKTITYLDEYRELISCSINNNIIEQLREQILLIEKSLKDDVKIDRIEMIFIPYKASMWDSMESVWLAAKKDPQCDAVVVPIPYYEKNHDGTLGEMIYEGGLYPENVDVINWREYNIEERRPDVIVIHNAYDNDNHVTTIHPAFYTEKLKKYTNMLVYIPYFTDSGEVYESLKMFFSVRGTLLCDRVIVTSEKVRQMCINMFEKNGYEAEYGNPRVKYAALGSPKFDKVINSKCEDFTLPKQWLRLIGNKKVVLYNTTINGSISENIDINKWLKKLRYVINTFRERKNVILWWRPHPLMEQNLAALRPEALNDYKDIVNNFKKESFGILDESADLHRAIAYSDAYYGDAGSLLSLYEMTGKSIMIQNADIYYKHEEFAAPFYFFDDKNKNILWLMASNFNGIFKLDILTGNYDFIGVFPGENLERKFLYNSGVKKENKIYFIPNTANEMTIYDEDTDTLTTIDIPEPIMKTDNYNKYDTKFRACAIYGENIFMFPASYPAILKYDIKNNTFSQINNWISKINTIYGRNQSKKPYFPGNLIISGSYVYSIIFKTNLIIEFNMDTCSSIIYEVGDKNNTFFHSICFDGEHFWINSILGDKLYRWDKGTGELKKYLLNTCEIDIYFAAAVYADDFVWLLPAWGKSSFRVNTKTEIIEDAEVFNALTSSSGKSFTCPRASGNKLYVYSHKNDSLVEYDIKLNKINEFFIKYNGLTNTDLNDKYLYRIETLFCNLHTYINSLVNFDLNNITTFNHTENNTQTLANIDGTAGEKIYSYLKLIVL